MTGLMFIALACATWYLSFIVTGSDGPFHIFEKLRMRVPMGGLTTCIVCLSIWIALALRLIVALATGEMFSVVMLIEGAAVAGLALILHRYSGWFAA